MAKVPSGFTGSPNELYAESRRALLDALVALREHRGSIILIGAQAVYLRSERAKLQVAAFTSDADLGLDPRDLADMPRIEEAMKQAGFKLANKDQPGIWEQEVNRGENESFSIAVDLLVPEVLAGRGSRSAKIPPHANSTARRVPGIEATLVDKSPVTIVSLNPDSDPRSCTIDVAGPTALLIAKAFKIQERVVKAAVRPDRLVDKDAGDVVRLMMTNPAADVRKKLVALKADEMAGESTTLGLGYLEQMFGSAGLPGTQMAIRALQGSMEASRVEAITSGYIAQLRAT